MLITSTSFSRSDVDSRLKAQVFQWQEKKRNGSGGILGVQPHCLVPSRVERACHQNKALNLVVVSREEI